MKCVVLFGLAGSGKSYIGNLIQEHLGYPLLEGDDYLPIDLQLCIEEKKPFTQEMRDGFTQTLIEQIKKQQGSTPFVLAQALYKESNRQMILNAFPDAIFIHIDASPHTIDTRLKARADWVTTGYAIELARHFEPMPSAKVLYNEQKTSDTLIEELKALIGITSTCTISI